jgi:thiol:disulfide interchange protein DsbD
MISLRFGRRGAIRLLVACFVFLPLGLVHANGNNTQSEGPSDTVKDSKIVFHASLDSGRIQPGGILRLTVKCTPAHGFHTYPVTQQVPDGVSPVTTLVFNKADWYKPVWKTLQEQPAPELVIQDDGTKDGLKSWAYEKEVTWSIDLLVDEKAPPGPHKVEFKFQGQVCDSKACTPFDDKKRFALEVTVAGDPMVPSRDILAKLEDNKLEVRAVSIEGKTVSPPAVTPSTPQPETKKSRNLIDAPSAADYARDMEQLMNSLEGPAQSQTTDQGGTLSFVLAGIFWGFISLITPCVFPMIPITVSYFLKQSEKTHHRPITMASVYCATIVVVMTVAAISLLSFFQWLSQNAFTNLAIGVLFVVFALSLFGMYELELPSFVAQWTSSKESKGGFVGTIFMALTFTILSFACVAPFLGGFGGTATAGQFGFFDRVLGGLAFAITFASPFFVLAMFPSLLRKLPRSGTWLNSVKVVMGFLELAAAFKFLRLGELLLRPGGAEFFTYDLVLGLWIALAILCALYLLNFYRLSHDTPLENLGVTRVLLAGAFLCLAFYMLPAMFKFGSEGEQQRPAGAVYAWIDSFLLPEPNINGKLAWSGNLRRAVVEAQEEARSSGKPQSILLDMTGKSCSNCRYNENSVFPRPSITPLMQKYRLVQLYMDEVPADFYGVRVDLARQKEDADTNFRFQQKEFDNTQRPLYGVLAVDAGGKIKIAAVYPEAKINDVEGFAEFLRKNAGAK